MSDALARLDTGLDRWRYPRMDLHELWLPSSFGDAQFTRRALASIYTGEQQ